MGGHTYLKNLPRCLLSKTQTSVFASSSSISKTSKQCSSSKTPWQSSLHSVIGLKVETGWLHPPTNNQTQPQVNQVSSVLALHASGCSYKQWDKMGALLACPLVMLVHFGAINTTLILYRRPCKWLIIIIFNQSKSIVISYLLFGCNQMCFLNTNLISHHLYHFHQYNPLMPLGGSKHVWVRPIRTMAIQPRPRYHR